MSDFFFLPAWPPPVEDLPWLAFLLIVAVLAGEAVQRWLHLPRLLGWIAAGVAFGPEGAGLLDEDTLGDIRGLLDIGIGIVLFELGQRIDFGWLRRNPWLLGASALESALSFAAMWAVLLVLGMPPVLAAVPAAIGMATSPAVVLTLARELRAQGQVTERALLLTALNCLYALAAVSMLVAWLHAEYRVGWTEVVAHPLYLLAGSLVLGAAFAGVTLGVLTGLGERTDAQFICIVVLALVAIALAPVLHLPVALTLFVYGALTRVFDRARHFAFLEFGRLGQMVVILLFALSAANLEFGLVPAGALAGLALVIARFAGKTLGLAAFARRSALPARKAVLLGCALMPMSAVVLVLAQDTAELAPELGPALAAVILSALAMLEIVGPLAAQFAFKQAGETAAPRHGPGPA